MEWIKDSLICGVWLLFGNIFLCVIIYIQDKYYEGYTKEEYIFEIGMTTIVALLVWILSIGVLSLS